MSCSNNNDTTIITKTENHSFDFSFFIDSSKLPSPPRIKRRISIRNTKNDDENESNDDDDESSISSCSQSTFASNDESINDRDVWLINSDDDFDIDESSTTSSSSTHDFSDLVDIEVKGITLNHLDYDEVDTTTDCHVEELAENIIPTKSSYENVAQQNMIINECTSSSDHNQRSGKSGRRYVSFDSCTYIREYNLATSSVDTTTTSKDDCSCDENNKNYLNNKYLLQLSWEHTPIIIGSLHKREQQKRCKKDKQLRRLNIRQRRNRIELFHDIAINESNRMIQNIDDNDDNIINHHRNFEYHCTNGICNIDVAANHAEEKSASKAFANETTTKKLTIEDISWNDKNTNNIHNATNLYNNAKKPNKTTSTSRLEPLSQKEYPIVGATAA